MTTIQIQQHPNEPHQATLIFSHGTTYQIEIKPPFDEKQEQNLEWYFEQYLKFPFTNQVAFQEIADSIKSYGENLFEQVFGNRKAYADFQVALQGDLAIEIMGSAAFHSLHWESLKDPDMVEPLAVRFVMTRKPLTAQTQRQNLQMQASPVLRVLLVTSRPNGKNDVGYRTISQPLLEAIQNSKLPVQIDLLRPATYQSLIQHLENPHNGCYHILHFDVHGSVLDYARAKQGKETGKILFALHYDTFELKPYEGEKAFLFLDGDDDKPHAIEAADLKTLLARHGIPLVVLNTCQSAKQRAEQDTSLGSLLMQAGIQGVLAMAYSVTVTAAALYVKTLYAQLLQHADFNAAARRARFELYQNKQRKVYFNQKINLEDWLLPVVYQQQAIKLLLREFHAEEAADWYEQQAKQYQPPITEYGFVGRDLDVLEIEKRLIQHNVLLLQGMGGAGKTTLLHHLMNWWQVTHFVKQVFYFGYDEKAHTRQQILHSIAQQILTGQELKFRFLPLSEVTQQAFLVKQLRATRHCLVLDNLESVTGAALAIAHGLSAKEQAELKDFIHALSGGETLVLLGSRSEESWLQVGSLPYLLNGLDEEAASVLADKILQKQQALHYRSGEQQAALTQLLKLLAGFPLALQVVLANTKTQTPQQILTALQAGDAAIDFQKGNSQSRTESILRCIEYSYSPLSESAQALLLCVAPFKSVLFLPLLEKYSQKLQAQPLLADLPFADWQTVLAEAQHWGLISAHEVEGFISLQPALSYFLNFRLQQDKARQQAIQTAFREVYDILGNQLRALINSKEAQEKQLGQYFTQLEYENLSAALHIALAAQVSIQNFYAALSTYLDTQQAQQQGLELGQTVLQALETYPAALLQGELGYEFVGVLDDLAKRYLLLQRYAEAEQSYKKALALVELITALDEKTKAGMKASVYHQLGIVAQQQREFAQARDYYQQALAIQIEFKDRYEQAGTYHQLGRVAEEQREFSQARDYYQQALGLFIELNDRHSQASTYHQLGNMAQEQRDFAQAHEYYRQALAIYIEFNDRYQQAGTYQQLGTVAQQQHTFTQAHEYYQQALAIKIEFNDRYSQASTYQQLGSVTQEQREFAQAREYYQQALAIQIEFNDRYSQASTYHQLGNVAQEQREFAQARDYYQQALAIYTEFNDRYSQANIYSQLGGLAEKQENWQQGQNYFLQALKIFVDYKDELNINISLKRLIQMYHPPSSVLITEISNILGVSAEEVITLFEREST